MHLTDLAYTFITEMLKEQHYFISPLKGERKAGKRLKWAVNMAAIHNKYKPSSFMFTSNKRLY